MKILQILKMITQGESSWKILCKYIICLFVILCSIRNTPSPRKINFNAFEVEELTHNTFKELQFESLKHLDILCSQVWPGLAVEQYGNLYLHIALESQCSVKGGLKLPTFRLSHRGAGENSNTKNAKIRIQSPVNFPPRKWWSESDYGVGFLSTSLMYEKRKSALKELSCGHSGCLQRFLRIYFSV